MPEPGELIGPYRLVSQLGKGAMGEVWRARDERLDRYVALKVLPAELADDAERRARIVREARAAAAIRHINVVTLFDIISHRGDDVLVMELVEGRTLSDILRHDGAPALEVGLRWLVAIADALAAAHARKILHRDIKAANVMVTSDGTVKVLDFGLAKVWDEAQPATASSAAASLTTLKRTALAETMPGGMPGAPAGAPTSTGTDSYATTAGSLLGTPLYMAPEQVAGKAADERSEVYSLGVLAYEVIAGKPPYSATAVEELFQQIEHAPPPELAAPDAVASVVVRALAKQPAARFSTMGAFGAALDDARRRVFAPRAKGWPWVAAACAAITLGAIGTWWALAHRTAPPRPGDDYVRRALEEYDVFYQDKALSSLRAALAVAPNHPRANAYMILFGGGSPDDRDAALAAAKRALVAAPDHSKDRALLAAAIATVEQGVAAAREALAAAHAERDRELAFWAAELDYRAGHYDQARDEYRALLAEPAPQFRGRIYDHDSSVLLYFDEPDEALRIGTLYRDAYPGEADAVGVYATTLAAAGRLDDAAAAAEDALRLAEGEDTLAGLAKVLALRGDRARAEQLYRRSIERAGPARRPLRRAALALLQWIDGDAAGAVATTAPCLDGADAAARERGACLFVAGVVDVSRAEAAATQLDALAAEADATHPAYGSPASLARLLRARQKFFAGGCAAVGDRTDASAVDEAAYADPPDFFAAYHLPFFATWALCERAALRAARGDRAGAAALLAPVASRAPHRDWLRAALAKYQ